MRCHVGTAYRDDVHIVLAAVQSSCDESAGNASTRARYSSKEIVDRIKNSKKGKWSLFSINPQECMSNRAAASRIRSPMIEYTRSKKFLLCRVRIV